MYRFLLRPRWIVFTLVVAAAVVAMINLGFWQLRRLDERREFNADVESRIDQPVAAVEELVPREATVGDDELAEIEWRPVTAAGRYLHDEQLLVVNRSQRGRAGDNVVTPLLLDDGRVLLIVRGFVPLGAEATPAPEGEVAVAGRLRRSDVRRGVALQDREEGELTEAQRVDIPRLEAQLPGDVVPMYVELAASEPPEVGPFPEPVEEPALDEGPHLSYAVQWFAFSALAIVGWAFAVRHGQRASQLRASRSASTTTGSSVPEGGEDLSADESATYNPS